MLQFIRLTSFKNTNIFNVLAILATSFFVIPSFATQESFNCTGETIIGHVEVSDLIKSKSKNYSDDFINLQLAVGEQVLVLSKNDVAVLDNGKYGRIYLGSKNSFSVSFSINQKKTSAELSLKSNGHELLVASPLKCEASE